MVNRLTPNFTLEELTITSATRLGLDNTPPPGVMANLSKTARGLEEVRALVSSAIVVNSGYRSPAVNAHVGGAKASQHLEGKAADIICPKFSVKRLMLMIYKSKIVYDQLIQEFVNPVTGSGGWVHISFSDNPRMQALIIDANGTRKYA